jgi:hypothetical protein
MIVRSVVLCAAVTATVVGAASQSVIPIPLYVPAPSSSTTELDYVIEIDGAVVPATKLFRAPHPLSAIVLHDVSSSMMAEPLATLTRPLANHVRQGETIRLATFADKILIGTTPIVDRASADRAAREVRQAGGASPLWDAICESLDALRTAAGLRAVVILSDGRASANDRGFEDTYELAIRSGVVLSVVALAEEAERAPSEIRVFGRNEGLQRLARGTGGTYVELRTRDTNRGSAVIGALDELRRRARLEFVPPVRDGAIHRVSVTLRGRPVAVPERLRF